MTESASADAEPGAPDEFVRYLFWSLDRRWREKPPEVRREGVRAVAELLDHPPSGLSLRTYSLVGTKAGTDGLLWMWGSRLELFRDLESRLRATPLGPFIDFPVAYLAMRRRSEYLAEHAHPGQEGDRTAAKGRRYLFVYPFVKKREWYALPFEERRRVMGEHFRIGHRFPMVDIHTGYSFGLDDAEFVLAFEADEPGDFLRLVQALRPSEASRFTALETPIFSCIATTPQEMLELASGIRA